MINKVIQKVKSDEKMQSMFTSGDINKIEEILIANYSENTKKTMISEILKRNQKWKLNQ